MKIDRMTPDVGYIDPATFKKIGVSQMVGVGDLLYLSGVVATGSDGNSTPEDLGQQITMILDIIERMLSSQSLDLSRLVSITCYTTEIDALGEYIELFAERFINHPPCSTWVEVKRLAAPEYKLEIGAIAAQ